MKRSLSVVAVALLLFSCKNDSDKEKFTVSGELKNTPDSLVYLEELFFSEAAPEVLDTGMEIRWISHRVAPAASPPKPAGNLGCVVASTTMINSAVNPTSTRATDARPKPSGECSP